MAKKKVSKKTVAKKVGQRAVPSKEMVTDESNWIFAENKKLEGSYCNVAVVHHSEREFVLDFIFEIANHRSLVSRVITNPKHMKRVYEVLGDNLEQYQHKYGEIK